MQTPGRFKRALSALLTAVILLFCGLIPAYAQDTDIAVEPIEFNNPDFIRGMDVSSVISLENSGVVFRDENGEAHVTDVVDFGLTLDERIADGFYFAKSVKVLKYILEHPEVLDRPLSEPLGIEF